MSLTRPGSSLLILLALLGCRAETFGDDDLAIDPATLHVQGLLLPGATVTLTAPWLSHAPDTIVAAIDGGAPLRLGRSPTVPSGFTLLLPPDLTSGTHDLSVRQGDGTLAPAGVITLGGFEELRYVTGSFAGGFGAVQSLPELAAIAGTSNDADGACTVVLLDVRNARLTEVGPAPICGYGLGASYLPATFLAYRGGQWPWSRVTVTPTGTRIDSIAVYGNNWPKSELAPDLYIGDEKNQTYLRLDSTSLQILDDFYHPERIAFSPDGRWAVASHSTSLQGALIVDRQSRSFHWSPGWIAYTHPLFLPDGRLVVYGWRPDPEAGSTPPGPDGEYLAHVDPATGTLTDSVRFGDAGSPYGQPMALASGLIVMSGWAQGHIELSFRDPNTLLEVAHARSPDFAPSCYFDSTVPAVEDPATRRIYFTLDDCITQIPVWTFQLPD